MSEEIFDSRHVLIQHILSEASTGDEINFSYRFVDPTGIRPTTEWTEIDTQVVALLSADDDADDEHTAWLELADQQCKYFPIVCRGNFLVEYKQLGLSTPPGMGSPQVKKKKPQVTSKSHHGKTTASKKKRPDDDNDEDILIPTASIQHGASTPTPPPRKRPRQEADATTNFTISRPELLSLLRQPIHEEPPLDFLEGFFDQATGMRSSMVQLVDGLRIPKAIEQRFCWLFPHLWMGRGEEYKQRLRLVFGEYTCVFKSHSYKESVDLDVDCLVDILDTPTPRISKERWRIPFFLAQRIATAVIHTSSMGNNQLAEAYWTSFTKAFVDGRLDLGHLWISHVTKSQPTSVTPAISGANVPPAATTAPPSKTKQETPTVDYDRLQTMIESSVKKAAASTRRQFRPRR